MVVVGESGGALATNLKRHNNMRIRVGVPNDE
jgi:hypothetical protein